MSPLEIIHAIAENWFLQEPAFYSLYCLQKLQENLRMECELRVGEGCLEYNPLLLTRKNLKEIELLMRIEMIRLFLKHPYERRPEGCSGEVIALGSDCTIADGYCLLKEAGALKGPGAYHLPIGQCYEWYCKAIAKDNNDDKNNDSSTEQNSPQSQQHNHDRSALWHDDTLRQTQINQLIERTSDWGTLPGDIVQCIQASTRSRLNRSMVFQGFKSNLLSVQRSLTRLRPNRRTGFIQMGSRREIEAHLLVAVDCSGSIDEETLARFFGLLNRLFRDGNVSIDVLQFDSQVIQIEPMAATHANIDVHGRGGTDFQPVINHLLSHSRQYDGLMILTDGEAPAPTLPSPRHLPILWVCKDESAYQQHHRWMAHSGRCCWI